VNAILSQLGLSSEQHALRKDSLGGSDANTIMSGDEKRLLQLWREKRGEAEPEDLSDVLAVQMGSFTEPLNVAWFEKNTGLAVGCVDLPDCGKGPPFMRCTLDGWIPERSAVFEAKHCGTRSTDAEIFARYVPQLTHNCICTGARTAFLSVFKGNGDWVEFEYDVDADYAARLVAAEEAFWRCVQTGEPPCAVPSEPTPKPVGIKEYDMEALGSNEWAVHCADFIETELAADRHEIAKKALKALVPDDASKCFGHGLIISRDKRGALRFSKGELA
jgi:predicted phage-related endonuclease